MAISQAFYLPSCPAENEAAAFFVPNTGAPLPVDEFVRRGQEIIDERKHKSSLSERNNLQPFAPMPETLENIERVKSMLSAIDPSAGRAEWRQICWAALSTHWACAESLILDWSKTSDKFTAEDFVKVVKSFRPDEGNSFGTLVFYAKQHGWSDSGDIGTERLTGLGGNVVNGRFFAGMWRGKLLYIFELAEWLKFDPQVGWLHAPPLEEDRAAKDVVDKLRELAAEKFRAEPDGSNMKQLMAHVERSSKAPSLRAMIEMAKSEAGMTGQAARERLTPLQERLARLLATIPIEIQREGLSLPSLQASLRGRSRGLCHPGELGTALRTAMARLYWLLRSVVSHRVCMNPVVFMRPLCASLGFRMDP